MFPQIEARRRRRSQQWFPVAIASGATATAAGSYMLLQTDLAPVSTIPWTLYLLLVGVVGLIGRSRSRVQWQQAWETYLAQEERSPKQDVLQRRGAERLLTVER